MEPLASSQAAPSFPTLEILSPSKHHTFTKPSKRINDGADVTHFLTSHAYRDIGIFIMQLNRAMCPRKVLGPDSKQTVRFFSRWEAQPDSSVGRLQALLRQVEGFIEEAPPDPGPRRFGNVSFRTWYGILGERVGGLMDEFLPAEVLSFGSPNGPREEIEGYFLGAFGSAQRLDYGTGHELSFIAFLGCLWKLGAFKDGGANGTVERSIVLGVIEP